MNDYLDVFVDGRLGLRRGEEVQVSRDDRGERGVREKPSEIVTQMRTSISRGHQICTGGRSSVRSSIHQYATVLTPIVIQIGSDCQDFCVSTPGSCISSWPIPTCSDLYIHLYITGSGRARGNWAQRWLRGVIRHALQVPRHLGVVIAGILRHHLRPLPFRWLPCMHPPINIALGGCLLVGNPSPGYPGVPPFVFRPYVLCSLYNHYFIGLFEKRDNKNLRNKILKKCHPM